MSGPDNLHGGEGVEHLLEKLRAHAESDVYPYHMPGHKRSPWGEFPKELYEMDITEIDGFDNLHQPEGILLQLQKEAARIYGAEESFYLVNGSTCGVLCALSAALPLGGRVLMARNCHKSAYHGAYLRNLSVAYLWPPYLDEYDIFDPVMPEQVEEALERDSDIGAVFIVSPTYEGRIADVEKIARIVHKKNIPLIVDEAHGAHLGLAEGFPKNSCQAGADLVIHSVHKTLPAPTQTALLHVTGQRIDRDLLRRFLHIYQSSSPSYVLMAGIDNALRYADENRDTAFPRFQRLYEEMMLQLAKCRHLRFPEHTGRRHPLQDTGKLLISVKRTGLTGKRLYDILLEKYHLQLEMASESFGLAMFTVNDRGEAYGRMTEALLEIDHGLESVGAARAPWLEGGIGGGDHWEISDAIPLYKAWDMPGETVALEESVGRRGGEFINLYPPGTPLLVPGERMTEELCQRIKNALKQGLAVQGVIRTDPEGIPWEEAYVKVLRD